MLHKTSLTGLDCTFENLFGQSITLSGTFTSSPEPVQNGIIVMIMFTDAKHNTFTISGLPVPDFSMVIRKGVGKARGCPWQEETNSYSVSAFSCAFREELYLVRVKLLLGGIAITGTRKDMAET